MKMLKNTDHTNYGCFISCHEKLSKKPECRTENRYVANKTTQNYSHTKILTPLIHERPKLLTVKELFRDKIQLCMLTEKLGKYNGSLKKTLEKSNS